MSAVLSLTFILIQPHCMREAGLSHAVEIGKMDSPGDRGCAKPESSAPQHRLSHPRAQPQRRYQLPPCPTGELVPHLDEGGAFLAVRSSLGAAAGPGSHCGCRLVPGIVLQHTTVGKEKLHRILCCCSKSHAHPSQLPLQHLNAVLQATFPSAHAVYQAHRCYVLPTEKPPTPFTKQENTRGISSPTFKMLE